MAPITTLAVMSRDSLYFAISIVRLCVVVATFLALVVAP
jgi:hypothetical protein